MIYISEAPSAHFSGHWHCCGDRRVSPSLPSLDHLFKSPIWGKACGTKNLEPNDTCIACGHIKCEDGIIAEKS